MDSEFYRKVSKIVKSDPRYKIEAYEFLMEALFYTQTKLKRQGHVTGRELLRGIKEYAIDQFGSLAHAVLEAWGVKKTDDFGEIVFNLVNNNLLKKTEHDSIEDFKEVYEFKEAFNKEFRKKFSEEIKRGFSLSNSSKKKNYKKI